MMMMKRRSRLSKIIAKKLPICGKLNESYVNKLVHHVLRRIVDGLCVSQTCDEE